MRVRLGFIGAAAVVLGVMAPGGVVSPAQAQSSGRNPAAAQALYDEARRLVQAGNFQGACPKFKESYQLDPGGGTLLNLADCYEKQGRLALAWSTFKDALVVAQRDRRDDRVEFANQHIASLESRLAHITVYVAEDARVPGLSVSVDGSPLGEAAWGVAMPADPGKHIVRAEAPGKRPFITSIEVASPKAVRESVEIPPLL
jgi:tetratricopeptide (TPR) repeat protein